MGTVIMDIDDQTERIRRIYFQAEHDKAVERLQRIIRAAFRSESLEAMDDDAEASNREAVETL